MPKGSSAERDCTEAKESWSGWARQSTEMEG